MQTYQRDPLRFAARPPEGFQCLFPALKVFDHRRLLRDKGSIHLKHPSDCRALADLPPVVGLFLRGFVLGVWENWVDAGALFKGSRHEREIYVYDCLIFRGLAEPVLDRRTIRVVLG